MPQRLEFVCKYEKSQRVQPPNAIGLSYVNTNKGNIEASSGHAFILPKVYVHVFEFDSIPTFKLVCF